MIIIITQQRNAEMVLVHERRRVVHIPIIASTLLALRLLLFWHISRQNERGRDCTRRSNNEKLFLVSLSRLTLARARGSWKKLFACAQVCVGSTLFTRLSRRTVASREQMVSILRKRKQHILANTSARKIFAASPEFIESYVLQNDKRKEKIRNRIVQESRRWDIQGS